MKETETTKVIDQLSLKVGGMDNLADEFKISGEALRKWRRKDSIPADRVPHVLTLAVAYDVDTSAAKLRPDVYKPIVFRQQG